jgi:hypothetical protein
MQLARLRIEFNGLNATVLQLLALSFAGNASLQLYFLLHSGGCM